MPRVARKNRSRDEWTFADCQYCGEKLQVIKTVFAQTHTTRVRTCLKCARGAVSTYEISEAWFSQLKQYHEIRGAEITHGRAAAHKMFDEFLENSQQTQQTQPTAIQPQQAQPVAQNSPPQPAAHLDDWHAMMAATADDEDPTEYITDPVTGEITIRPS